MIRTIISVRRRQDFESVDLEVPAEISIKKLSSYLSKALTARDQRLGKTIIENGLPLSYTLYNETTDQTLQSGDTLARANVWDGASLVIEAFSAAHLVSAGKSQSCYALNSSSIVLGRHDQINTEPSTITTDDTFLDLSSEAGAEHISRSHAEIFYNKGQWQLRHISATNDTLYNGQELLSTDCMTLTEGDLIELGPVELVFRVGHADV